MKKQTKLLSTCLTLAIIGTTLAPATCSGVYSKKTSQTVQKRSSTTVFQKAGKRPRTFNVKFLEDFQAKEKQKRQEEKLTFPLVSKDNKHIPYENPTAKVIQEECLAIKTMKKEDRQFLYECIVSSPRNIFLSYKNVEKFELCIRYLKRRLYYVFVYVPPCHWSAFLNLYFAEVFREKSKNVVDKLLPYLINKLSAYKTDRSLFEKVCTKIIDDLKLF